MKADVFRPTSKNPEVDSAGITFGIPVNHLFGPLIMFLLGNEHFVCRVSFIQSFICEIQELGPGQSEIVAALCVEFRVADCEQSGYNCRTPAR